MKKLDMLLIQPFQGVIDKFSGCVENLGIGFISSYLLSHGFSTEVLYPTFYPKKFEQKLSNLLKRSPSIIGLSVVTYYYHPEIKKFTKLLRKKGYKNKIVVGGHSISFYPEEILKQDENVDYVIVGQGEEPTRQLIQALKHNDISSVYKIPSLLYRYKNRIIKNDIYKKFDISNIPIPDRRYLDDLSEKEKANTLYSVSLSRGCFGTCEFCSIYQYYKKFSNRMWSTRDLNDVTDEIKWLNKKGIKEFMFVDDEFFGNAKDRLPRIYLLCSLLKKKNIHTKFCIQCRADSISREVLAELKEVGLVHVFLGVEFFTDEELKLYRKNISLEKNKEAIRLIKDLGLSLQCGFIMFHPYSTLNYIKRNLEMSDEVGEGKPFNFTTKLDPYYGTRIHSKIKKDGLLKIHNHKPSIKFKDSNVKKLYSFAQLLLKKYMRLVKIYLPLVDSITFEWRRIPQPGTFYYDYKNQLDNCINQLNQKFFDIFYATTNFLIKFENNINLMQEWCSWKKIAISRLNQELKVIEIQLVLLTKIKEEYNENRRHAKV